MTEKTDAYYDGKKLGSSREQTCDEYIDWYEWQRSHNPLAEIYAGYHPDRFMAKCIDAMQKQIEALQEEVEELRGK